ncbi:MAG: 6-carboxytetrahydropterin synthase QueD [Eubacterium sp.]|nr:6-carboxytetrahydropterin synthase QueD [Eubacterium sp.]
MLTVTKIFKFEAAHWLPFYDGACHNLHGHSYKLEVTVTGKINENVKNPQCGMIIDFSVLKGIVEEKIIRRFDHSNLNDFFSNPTAENMVEYFAESINMALPTNIVLVSIKLWETDSSYAEITRMC